jgi:hypothetical protein
LNAFKVPEPSFEDSPLLTEICGFLIDILCFFDG